MTTTDMIDRYLHAVQNWLPRKQQKDIVAELADDLHAQIEDREQALGHPLDEAGMVELLKQRGSPLRVASSFIPEHRLINPAMLPIYRLVLKIVLLWVLAPIFAIVFVGPIFDSVEPLRSLALFFAHAMQALFFVIGIVTTVFFLMDRHHSKWVDNWNPRSLPRVPPPQQPMEWYNDFAGFAFGMGAFVFWGVTMWQRRAFVLGPGLRIDLSPVWGAAYWVILALTLGRAVVDLYCFVRRAWTPARSWMRLALDGGGMLLALWLIYAGNLHWVDFSMPNATAADSLKAVNWLNSTIEISLGCAAVIPVFDVVKQARLLYRRARNPACEPVSAGWTR